MNEFQTGAVRDTGGKGRMDLLPWCALRRISKHMEDAISPDPDTGMPHYPERNWEKGIPMHSMIDSAFRHLAKYVEGWTDEDHLCAAATNLLMAMWTEENRQSMQDIPTRLIMPLDPPTNVPTPDANAVLGTFAICADKTKCKYFERMGGSPRCSGTKDYEECSCEGNEDNCLLPWRKSNPEID